MHVDFGNKNIKDVLSYERLRAGWLSFLYMLDVEYENGFWCPKCSENNKQPEIIICDGTSVSFQRRMWHNRNSNVLQQKQSIDIQVRYGNIHNYCHSV